MRVRFYSALAFFALGVLSLSGCKHCCQGPCREGCRPAWRSRPAPAPLPPQAPAPVFPGPIQGPAGPIVNPVQPVDPVGPPPPEPTPSSSPELRGYSGFSAYPENVWHPPENGGVRLTAPEAASPEPPPAGANLLPPENKEPNLPRLGQPQSPLDLGRPGATEQKSPSLPVDIPGFAGVKSGVASGLRPSHQDGWKWLRAYGYRGVLHLREPGEPEEPDRQAAQSHGLGYESIEVSPRKLTSALVDDFNRLVRDPNRQPLFVYAKEGMISGGMWYLHFRLADQDSDEVARTKSARLGLKSDPIGEHKAMWLAIQNFLAEPNRTAKAFRINY